MLPVAPLVMLVAAVVVAATVWTLARRVRSGAREAHPGDDELPPGYYHARAVCVPPCPIHAPTGHHMATWRMSFHSDKDIFERQCGHGQWHPDPDSVEHWRVMRGADDAWGVSIHGCACRCCVPGGGRAAPV